MQNRQQSQSNKQSHKLPPQTSVLWIAEKRGYLSKFEHSNYSTVESPDAAKHFDEDRASTTAMHFKRATGLTAAVRPYYNFQ